MKEPCNKSTPLPSRHITVQIQQTQDDVLIIDFAKNFEDINFTVTLPHREPRAELIAYVVRDLKNGLAWTEIDGFGVSPICGFDQIPTVVQTVTETALHFGHHLEWHDDHTTD